MYRNFLIIFGRSKQFLLMFVVWPKKKEKKKNKIIINIRKLYMCYVIYIKIQRFCICTNSTTTKGWFHGNENETNECNSLIYATGKVLFIKLGMIYVL